MMSTSIVEKLTAKISLHDKRKELEYLPPSHCPLQPPPFLHLPCTPVSFQYCFKCCNRDFWPISSSKLRQAVSNQRNSSYPPTIQLYAVFIASSIGKKLSEDKITLTTETILPRHQKLLQKMLVLKFV